MPKRILAVDDQRHTARLMEYHLKKAGYDVALAYDGEEALAKVGEFRPDLVILDVMMPRMDGFEVLRHMKDDPQTEAIPVIMLTAKSEAEDALEGYDSGAQWYLTKPFDPEQLLIFVSNVLGPFSTMYGDAISMAPTDGAPPDDLA
jgi:two-component system alkaline phosphatase synthesis response regulator PhoP